jgi:iron complex outermembrane receptor protein
LSGCPFSTLASLAVLVTSPVPVEADTAALQSSAAPTAMAAAADPDRSPLPVAVVSSGRLRREHTLSLARAIENPGARALTTGGQMARPVLRGGAGPRVLVLDGGYRLEDYSWIDEDGPSLDARVADRVDVIRGPASVLYGSDALAGAVNAVPADLPDARGRSAFTRTGVEAYGASNNAELGGAVRVEHGNGAFGGRLFVVGRGGGDLHAPDGRIPNTGFGAGNGEAALGVRGAAGGASLRYARTGGAFELLDAGTSPPAQIRHEVGDNRVQLGGDFLLGSLRFEGRAQWQGHSLIETAEDAGGSRDTQFHLHLDTWQLDLLAHHAAGDLRGTLGVTGLAQTNDTRGPIPVVPDARTHSGAAFALEGFERGRLGILAGARVDWRHVETEGNADLGLPDRARDDHEVSANGGLRYRVSDALAVTANAGRGWRAPSLFELYANGRHLGEARYELGDPDLGSERSFQADAGVRVNRPRAKLELTGFVNRIDRYIDVVPTGDTRAVGADTLPVYEYTQADARLEGGELWAEIEAALPLTVRAQAEVVSGTNLDLDRPLPRVPPWRAALEAEYHRESLGWAERAAVGLEVEHVSEQTRLDPLDLPTDAYTLLHLTAGMTRSFGGRAYQVDLRVRNLADLDTRSFLSRYKGFASDPGRNVVIRITTEL